MKTIFCALLVLAAAATSQAQQYNVMTASMNFDGLSPVTAPMVFNCSRGLPHQAQIGGLPNMPFIVYGSPTMLNNGIFINGYGLVDINPVGYYTLFNGMTNPLFNTGATGLWLANFTLASSTPLNTTQSYQTMMADITSSSGARLTMATKLVVSAGMTTLPMAIGENSYQSVSLSTYGLSFPFYANTYSTVFMSDNGYASFTTADSDFTPTTGEFTSGFPRIAGKWTDFLPPLGGSMNVQINQGISPATIQFNWITMAEWGNNGPTHTFSIKLTTLTGDIDIIHPFNSPMVQSYDSLTGISAGNNLGPNLSTMKNLSGMFLNPLQGAANENFHEWNGLIGGGMPYYSPPGGVSWPFDLTGKTVTFYGVGLGAAGASYFGSCTP